MFRKKRTDPNFLQRSFLQCGITVLKCLSFANHHSIQSDFSASLISSSSTSSPHHEHGVSSGQTTVFLYFHMQNIIGHQKVFCKYACWWVSSTSGFLSHQGISLKFASVFVIVIIIQDTQINQSKDNYMIYHLAKVVISYY